MISLYYASNTTKKEIIVDYIIDNERPIYLQLVQKIRIEIVSGKLKKGQRLLPVRELAMEAKVNPNTMQKALVELEKEGLVYTESTNGRFVTENEELIENIKKDLAKEKINTYINDMKNIGISYEDALKYLQELGGKIDGTTRV